MKEAIPALSRDERVRQFAQIIAIGAARAVLANSSASFVTELREDVSDTPIQRQTEVRAQPVIKTQIEPVLLEIVSDTVTTDKNRYNEVNSKRKVAKSIQPHPSLFEAF